MSTPPIVIDTNALPWEERPNEKIGRPIYRKFLIDDPDTGMGVRLTRYPAGVINPWHTHHCAHGMFVLEGTLGLRAPAATGRGRSCGSPRASLMQHGATAEGDARHGGVHHEQTIRHRVYR